MDADELAQAVALLRDIAAEQERRWAGLKRLWPGEADIAAGRDAAMAEVEAMHVVLAALAEAQRSEETSSAISSVLVIKVLGKAKKRCLSAVPPVAMVLR